MKITGGILAFLIFYVAWYVRSAKAKARLREIDEGRRCVACNGTDLDRRGDHARCNRCGHVVSLADLQSTQLSASEIDAMTRPDDRRNL